MSAADAQEFACYVYGVVPASTREPENVAGVGDPPSPVTLVRHRGVAAVVSDIDPARPLGTPGDLLGHARVLDALAAGHTPVLPFRFGAVVRDPAAVADDLLAPQEQRFQAALEDLAGLAQFTVRAVHRQDRLLREIVEQRPDIAELREQVAALPEDASRHQQIRLGELVADELLARARADADQLVADLGPLAVATAGTEVAADQPVGVSFLVAADRWDEFEQAAGRLGAAWDGRIDLRLLGPLAPYDFASQLVDAQGRGSWD
ncbi:GvpL/GvpF family gas vesicle protein [Streptomyces sp. TLI_171]|uniref:GvpL/GvpF family gas vesicle protein n=1 Tax=Streptomyces sp. TLI_171 TaxID=1938859 RepID=UPI000C17F158|nr:GvpL/GvpF family gas vesicle protein [Streptomyces sp. TLI_171]RKE17531.1 gas vesicle protein GvpL/GvpF [Streptomyces sp. TLI_171]